MCWRAVSFREGNPLFFPKKTVIVVVHLGSRTSISLTERDMFFYRKSPGGGVLPTRDFSLLRSDGFVHRKMVEGFFGLKANSVGPISWCQNPIWNQGYLPVN